MGLSIYGWFFEALLVGSGHYYVDNENGRAAAATKIEYDTNGGGKMVMEAWKDLVDSGVCFNYGIDNDSAKSGFMAGDTAITFESTAQLTTITNGASFEVGCAMLPSVLEERVNRAIIGGGNLWMVKNDDEQRTADTWTFMKFMASAEPAAAFSMATGYYAANSAAYEVPSYVEYLEANPNAKVALDQLNASELSNLTGSLFTGVSPELRQIWQSLMDEYLMEIYTIDEVLVEMAAQSNAALDTYNATTAG
jgi:sn-glycerol 3-phosphate transport system substrate-binding protein